MATKAQISQIEQAIRETPYLAPYRAELINRARPGIDITPEIQIFRWSAPNKTVDEQRALVEARDAAGREARAQGVALDPTLNQPRTMFDVAAQTYDKSKQIEQPSYNQSIPIEVTGGPTLPAEAIAAPAVNNSLNIRLQTGDTALDEFLNGPFLQAVRDQLGGDPLAVYRALNDPAVLKQAIDRAGEAYGETFKLARDRVERNFQIQQGEVDLRRREQIGEIAQNLERQGVERTRAIEDATNIVNQAQQQFGLTESDIDLRRREQIADIESQTGQLGVERTRTEEDLGEGRTRIARNMQNAIQESAAAFASAGRAFGEGRVEAERKISEKSSERLADIEKQAKRSLENIQKQEQDLQKQRGFGEEQFGLAGREAQMGLERTQQQARLGQERSLQDITRQESALSAQRGFVGEQAGLAERRLGLGREEDLGELTGQERALGLGEVQLLRDLAGNLLKNPEYTGR